MTPCIFEKKPPKVPTRMCVICRTRAPKISLHRFCKNTLGTWELDEKQKKQNRGIYLCNQEQCRIKVKKHQKYSTIVL